MKSILIVQLITILGFWALFLSFQNKTVYHKTLGLVSDNWQNKNGDRTLVNEPYHNLTKKNYVQWDGNHYNYLKNNGYLLKRAKDDFIFAFFPLFPLIWKLSGLPSIGILFLNFIFFSVSIMVLLRLFSNHFSYQINTLIALSFPSIIVFFIPYTEATFLLMVTIGIYGFFKNKYRIFFMGLLLASLTRPSYTFFGLAIICAEIFFFINHKKVFLFLKNLFFRILPLMVGTLLLSIIQFIYGSSSFFKFVEVQKYWDHMLALPDHLSDWSHEGFAINIGVVFIIFVPLLIAVFRLLYFQIKNSPTPKLKYENPRDYLLILSMIYLIGNILFVLLYRGGSLHCLFRFTLCSPFFFVLLFAGFPYINKISFGVRALGFTFCSFLSIYIVNTSDYSGSWNFSDFGLLVLIGALMFWLFQNFAKNILYRTGLILLFILNLVWTTYLFNTYISNGWIFA